MRVNPTAATLFAVLWLASGWAVAAESVPSRAGASVALINGQWFNGTSFEPRTMYSVGGRFQAGRPEWIDRTLDLAGTWIVPPFGEAHNHNLSGAQLPRQLEATLARYLADGVFYVKIQGNYPLRDELRQRLPMNRPEGPDVIFAQGFLTASGGHPIRLHEELLFAQGLYAGLSREQLGGNLYVTIDSEADLAAKWPAILAMRPDFIKANLWSADEFAKRRDDPRYTGMRGLDPALLPKIVARARQAGLRVSVHITNTADFREAVTAGVDEIVHSGGPSPFNTLDNALIGPVLWSAGPIALAAPFRRALADAQGATSTYVPLSAADARRAAAQRTTVVTTIQGVTLAEPEGAESLVWTRTAEHLQLLRANGVNLVIGSDNPADTSLLEFQQLAALGVFDNLAMLKMWAEATPRAVFPDRRIGALEEGYEASFLALEGNPLEDLDNVRRIRLRFKQGQVLAE